MDHPLLSPHAKIAWDMDGTLVDSPNARFFQHYIIETPWTEHHVVTFRGLDHVPGVYRQLAEHGVTPDMIAGVHACPQDLRAAYDERNDPVKLDLFLRWKGLTAAGFGCTLLVDDMRELVIKGCEEHGVAYIDSWKTRTFPFVGDRPTPTRGGLRP